MSYSTEPLQVGDKVIPWDTWAESMPAAPRLRQGHVYCVEEVADTVHGPRASFVGVRRDGRCKGSDRFWPTYAFRLVHRAGDRPKQEKEAA